MKKIERSNIIATIDYCIAGNLTESFNESYNKKNYVTFSQKIGCLSLVYKKEDPLLLENY